MDTIERQEEAAGRRIIRAGIESDHFTGNVDDGGTRRTA